jgi:predicted SnoaL-like aldol condensation-catalyzing enzyme
MSNLTLAHDFADIINAREIERFDDLLHPDYINHRADDRGPVRWGEPGREGSKAIFVGFLEAVPDLKVTVHDALAAGDRVVGRYSYTGTFTNPWLGNAPTGAQVTMTSIDIWRVQDGRLIEHWDEINSFELLAQLGAVAAPEMAS